MVSVLKAHHRRQLEEKIRFADLYENGDLIFATRTGTPFNAKHLKAVLQAITGESWSA
jgi:hypothetical protein